MKGTKVMKGIRPFVATGVVLLVAAVIAPTYGVWTANLLNPPVIGTIDLERVFNDIEARIRAEADLEAEIMVLQTRADEMREEARRLAEELEMFVAGTAKFQSAQKQLMQSALDYRAMTEFVKLKLDASRAEFRRGLFNQIIEEASKYAQANGIDFILTNDSQLPIQEGSDMQVVQQLALRRVVYAAGTYDITDGLIEWINTP